MALIGKKRALLMGSGGNRPIKLSLTATAGQVAYLQLTTSDAKALTIDWGDGNRTLALSGTEYSHTYAVANTDAVKVSLANGSKLTEFMIPSDNTVVWNFDLSVFSASNVALTYLNLGGSSLTISGDISGLTSLTYLRLSGNNFAISGDISGLTSLTKLVLGGSSLTIVVPSTWTGATLSVRQVDCHAYTIATAVIDALLISLDSVVASWSAEKFISLKGTRTSASDAAYTSLTAKGVNVAVSA